MAQSDAPAANPWPEIDLAADALISKERDLGRLEFVAQPKGADWKIDRLRLANDAGQLDASGGWRVAGRAQQTKLDVVLDAKDAGAFLARYGYAEGLKGAPTRIDGQLAWSGAPHEFDFNTLNGNFRIQVGPGRFTKLEPGPGQAPRRAVAAGAAATRHARLQRRLQRRLRVRRHLGQREDRERRHVDVGSRSSSVRPPRSTSRARPTSPRETQRLTVRVQPALSSSVSAGAALLFLANPLVGAAVGAGSLFAQTLLQDPVEKIFRYEYTVTGGWSDPIVVKSGGGDASVAPATAALPKSTSDR